jgi:hypothetical protein
MVYGLSFLGFKVLGFRVSVTHLAAQLVKPERAGPVHGGGCFCRQIQQRGCGVQKSAQHFAHVCAVFGVIRQIGQHLRRKSEIYP